MKRYATLLVAAGIALTCGARMWAAGAAAEAPPPAAVAEPAPAPVSPSPGKALLEANCMSCHNEALYTSENRRIANLDALRKRVASCADGARLGWSDAQKEEVSSFLNAAYYKFN
jgi:cytochrome c5